VSWLSEAAARCGSLITARFAPSKGARVFAGAGLAARSAARGCNDLLRHGATLTETAEDVLLPSGRSCAGSRRCERVPAGSIAAAPSWSPPAVVEPADNDVGFELILERLDRHQSRLTNWCGNARCQPPPAPRYCSRLELVEGSTHPGNFVSLR